MGVAGNGGAPRGALAAVLFTLFPVLLFAEEQPAKAISTDDVLVTASRSEQRLFDAPMFASVVGRRDMDDRQSRTTPEALSEETGIHVQSTRTGAGSPFIRGLTGNQVLILFDGVRFNNAIFRFGPNQYLNTVNPFSLERIEVLRGPASVLYGSDAMGGTINVLTRDPALDESGSPAYSGALLARYGSAAQENTGSVSAEGSAGGVGAFVVYGRRNFDSLDGGSATGLQPFTGYREENAFGKLRWELDDHQAFTAALSHVYQTGVERKDKLDAGKALKRQFQRQQTDLGYLRYQLQGLDGPLTSLQATVSLNRQVSVEDRIKSSKPTTERFTNNTVTSTGLAVQARSNLGDWSDVVAGVETYQDLVDSSRNDVDLVLGTAARKTGSFPDNSRYVSSGIYVQDTLSPWDRLDVVLGGRYSLIRVNTLLEEHVAGFGRLEESFRQTTGSARLRFGVTDWWNLFGGVSQGFRAPNLDDLAVIESTSTGQDVPSPGTNPESSLNYELGTRFDAKPGWGWVQRVRASLAGSAAYFRNLIVSTPGTFNGFSTFDDNGNGVIDATETTPVRRRRNTGRAFVKGIEAQASVDFTRNWRAAGNFSWFATRDRVAEEPLSRTPPAQGLGALRYTADGEAWWVEGVAVFVDKAERLSARDAGDFRIIPGGSRRPAGKGTPGYSLFHLRGGARLWERFDLTLAVENLGNRDYRRHGSSFNGPGTNFVMSLEARF